MIYPTRYLHFFKNSVRCFKSVALGAFLGLGVLHAESAANLHQDPEPVFLARNVEAAFSRTLCQGKYAQGRQTREIKRLFHRSLQSHRSQQGVDFGVKLRDLEAIFFSKLDQSWISGPAKYSGKQAFRQLLGRRELCRHYRIDPSDASLIYEDLTAMGRVARVQRRKAPGGVADIASETKIKQPYAKIGVVLAANSGLPGGALQYRADHITEDDLSLKTQEESVWANAVLTVVGKDSKAQASYNHRTIRDQWGLPKENKQTTMTLQGVDFTTARPGQYNQVYVVSGKLSALKRKGHSRSKFKLQKGSAYPVKFLFADSVNANAKIGSPQGSMQRTCNRNAIRPDQYDYFRSCIKHKARATLDAAVQEGVTHLMMVRLSSGIYAGVHQDRIQRDFEILLDELLHEKVGPNGELRGQYLESIVIAEKGPQL